MMNDFIVNVEKSTRMVILTKSTIGNDMENLQEKLIFKFTDTFVNGTGRLEYEKGSTKNYILLTKENDTYTLPVKNVITKEGKIEMQLVITEGTNEHDIPVFKSNTFYLYCNKSINAVDEAPASYDLWIEQANAKLNAMDIALDEVDNLDIDVKKVNHTATIEITKKDGTTKEVEIIDGQNGVDGITPTIGQNGNWYLGETDTGKPSRGIQGENGQDGQDGYTPQKGVDYFTSEDIASLNIPTNLSDLTDDTTHRLVSDSEKSTWNSKSDFSGNYNDLTNKPTKLSEFTDDLGSNPTHTHSQYLTSHQDISMKQDIEDNTLNTNNKTVPSAINEVNSIAKGANQALSYSNYQAMITAFNNLANNVHNVGQNVMIITLNVPDLWISAIESTSQSYTYTSDSDFTNALATNGYVQVGYYKLSALETQKVDLTNYVTNTDYATSNKGGVVKTANGFAISNGTPYANSRTYNQYLGDANGFFIGKSTLENVIAGKNLETANNKVTSISSSSTDTQYPSALAVYNYIQSLNGDEVSY